MYCSNSTEHNETHRKRMLWNYSRALLLYSFKENLSKNERKHCDSFEFVLHACYIFCFIFFCFHLFSLFVCFIVNNIVLRVTLKI